MRRRRRRGERGEEEKGAADKEWLEKEDKEEMRMGRKERGNDRLSMRRDKDGEGHCGGG